MLALFALVTFFGASSPDATGSPISSAGFTERECRQLYKKSHPVCSEALGAWLPIYLDFVSDPSNRNAVTRGVPADTFVFSHDGKRLMPPIKQTFFSYGSALPKGSIVYDPIHHLVFFSQSCCAWGERVLARAPTPPPVGVRTGDLHGIHTRAGITIGSTAAAVVARYGRATAYRVPGHPGFEVLSYTSRRTRNDPHNPCGSDQNFVLKRGRVVYIQLGGAC